MKRYYLAYGSNLDVRQMRWRCPTAKVIGTGTIPGYELLYKGSQTGAYLTIEMKEGGSVPVAVWEVTDRDERSLDRYEGFPNFYYKKELKLPVTLHSGKVKKLPTFVYIMHEERKLGIPSPAYIRTCPKCGKTYTEHPAYSRVDGSAICPDCGTREALESIGVSRDEQEQIIGIIHDHTISE